MLKNYLRIALRNLMRNRFSSAINIFGLAIGLAACLLIAAYVRDETHYDHFAARYHDIYRVNLGVVSTTTAVYPQVDVAVGPGMAAAYPEIEASTRLTRIGRESVQYGALQFREEGMVAVDSNFFELFTLPFLEGDVHTALIQPYSLVITKAFATKYFGRQPALGKTLLIPDRGACKVTGVIDQIPDAAHFHFDAFLSLSSIHFSQYTWSNLGYYTYLMLRPGADAKKLEARFPELVAKYAVPEIARDMGVPLAEAKKAVNTFIFSLIPLNDIHLNSDTKYEIEAGGNSRYVLVFSALAVFILLLACANFTNLSTAGASSRSKEIGVRKVMGSLKQQLMTQFLLESILLTAFSMLLAFLLVFLLLPWFNPIAGKHFTFGAFFNFPTLLSLLAGTLVVGALAGVYPAFFLSSFNPIKVLKGANQGNRKNLTRSGLVVFQFVVSIALIVATLVVYRQLHFMQDKRLGYNKDQVLFIGDGNLLGTNQDAFRQQLLSDKRVSGVSISWCVPGSGNMDGTEIYPKQAGTGGEIHSNIYHIDYDYVPTLGLQIVRGRNFTRGFPTDSSGVLLNETAVNDLGWSRTDPIGKTIVRSGRREFTVVGVVRDFHYLSVKERIAPLMMILGRNQGGFLVKINSQEASGFIDDTRRQWAGFHPDGPLSYFFLDDLFAKLYVSEQHTGQLFSAFTIIAILIAGLGLFGLATYMVKQRTREIGIRKVIGASVTSVLLLVSREFLLLVALAFLIAIPLTWWSMQQWLQAFPYRIPLSWWIFPIAGIAALAIAVVTISFQTIRAALANPVESLRTE
jgi:putative ABC transport system permease protein